MTRLIPRLGREQGLTIVQELRQHPVADLWAHLPQSPPVVVSPVGGVPVTERELAALREEILAVARRSGFPEPPDSAGARAADVAMGVILNDWMDVSASEASSDDVWTYLTCCWLLDVALWRWSGTRAGGEDRRYWGHVDRNTFRRLWIRAQVLDDGTAQGRQLFGLNEDELVAITERSSLMRDPRLARAIARAFSVRLVAAPTGPPRESLMREIAKRARRLTPFVEFSAIPDHVMDGEIAALVEEAAGALSGLGSGALGRGPQPVAPEVSPEVRVVGGEIQTGVRNGRELELVAVELARRIGYVTPSSLGEMIPGLDDEAARRALDRLSAAGQLVGMAKQGPPRYGIPHAARQGDPPVIADEERSLLRRLFGR